ncbi:MAG: hypothetical protein ABI597_12585 [Gammaproteobacteria bacterium]
MYQLLLYNQQNFVQDTVFDVILLYDQTKDVPAPKNVELLITAMRNQKNKN